MFTSGHDFSAFDFSVEGGAFVVLMCERPVATFKNLAAAGNFARFCHLKKLDIPGKWAELPEGERSRWIAGATSEITLP